MWVLWEVVHYRCLIANMDLKVVIGQGENIYQSWITSSHGWEMSNSGMWFSCFQLEKTQSILKAWCAWTMSQNIYVQVGTYIFGPQSKSIGLTVKDGPKTIAKFSPTWQYIVILRHPPKSTLGENFAQEKHSIESFYIEPSLGWSMCFKNCKARCPSVIEAFISHFYQTDWVMVMEGFSHMIENVSRRVQQLIIMEGNIDMHFWLENWKEVYVERVREPIPSKDPLWLDKEVEFVKNPLILKMTMKKFFHQHVNSKEV